MKLFCLELNENEDRLFIHPDVGGKTVYLEYVQSGAEPITIPIQHGDVTHLLFAITGYLRDVQDMERQLG